MGIGLAPAANEVIFTELMVDPSPAVGLPESEYVEIFNPSDKLLNINQLRLIDSKDTTHLQVGLLLPKQYILLVATNNLPLFPNNITKAGLVAFPNLSNSGESLTLLDPAGEVIDQVNYAEDWYKDVAKAGGGYALERIDFDNACAASENWIASTDPSGGTPGRVNAVQGQVFDTTAPQITKLTLVDDKNIEIVFSENITEPSVNAIVNYSISPSLNIEAVIAKTETTYILQTSGLATGKLYTIKISGITDCSNNLLTAFEQVIGIGKIPSLHQLIITELMLDPSPPVNLPESEYIEIYNPTNFLVSLKDLTVSINGKVMTVSDHIISPQSYKVLVPNTAKNAFTNAIGMSNWQSLLNTGGQLLIQNQREAIIFELTYDKTWYRDLERSEGGFSLEMLDTNFPCAESNNWAVTQNSLGGTPGVKNSVSIDLQDNFPPALVKAEIIDNHTIKLLFSEKILKSSAIVVKVTIEPFVEVEQITFDYRFPKEISLGLATALEPKQVYNIEVQNVQDCSTNTMVVAQAAELVLPSGVEKGDVLLTEILFNPPVGGVDFVELYNVWDKYLDLKGWSIGNGEQKKVLSEEHLIFPPRTFLVLTENISLLKQQYPSYATDNWYTMDLPSFPDDAGEVILYDSLGEMLDLFAYDAAFHLAFLDDVSGISLERIAISEATNNAENWLSAASTAGYGTPGVKNSQTIENHAQTNTNCYTVDPPVFSPNLDGYQDVTFIRYNCQSSGLIANINIYATSGRLVKVIAQNALLAASGYFRWDGTDDQGKKVRVGYYLIYIETFDTAGNVQKHRKKVVVGARF